MNSDFIDSLMYGEQLPEADQLTPPPAVIQLPAAAAPKKRGPGRPAKVAPPSMTLFAPLKKQGIPSQTALRVDHDTAEGFAFNLGSVADGLAVHYVGPNDRTVVQQLRDRATGDLSWSPTDYLLSLPLLSTWQQVSAAELSSALAFAMPAMSTDETRYNLNGIHVDGSVWSATDGHRLHRLTSAPALLGTDGKGILPSWALETVVRAQRWVKADSVAIYCDTEKRRITFYLASEGKAVTVTTRLVDGQFPDYRQVIPSAEGQLLYRAPVAALREELKRAPVILDAPLRKRVLRFNDFDAAPYCVSVVPREGALFHLPSVEGKHAAKTFAITLNGTYLDDALAEMAGEVTMRLDDELCPFVIESGDRLAVVMPMRR